MLVQTVTLIALMLFGVSYANPVAPSACPNFFEETDGVCYYYQFIPATWADAKKNCESLGSQLISIRDAKFSNWIKAPSQAGSVPFWFGLYKNRAGNFKWTDVPHQFDANGFTDWGSGQPNFSAGSCVSMAPVVSEGASTGPSAWMMTNCDMKIPSICSVPAIKKE